MIVFGQLTEKYTFKMGTYLRFWGNGRVAVSDRQKEKSGKIVPFLGDCFGTDDSYD